MPNFVDGNWCEGRGTTFISHNPATGQPVWTGGESTEEDVQNAVRSAQSASIGWARLSLDQRAAALRAFQKQVEADAEELARAITREVGKPLWEARTEVRGMIGKVPLTIQAIEQRRADTEGIPGELGQLTRHKPHGVMAVFGPFNFPGHISNGHIAPALLAGNTVVFKPSELTPGVAELMVAAWEKSGLPAGVLNLVQGGRATGVALVEAPIDGVLFTGSFRAGVSIAKALAERPETLLALELGGNNPLVIDKFEGSNEEEIDAAVYATIQSAFITSGQRCTCARRLIVVGRQEVYLKRLVEVASRVAIGPPDAEPFPFMGPVIHAAVAQRVLEEQQRLQESGATMLLPAKQSGPSDAFVSPGIIDTTDVDDVNDDEVFGPLLQVRCVPDLSAAIDEANATKYGLVAGLLSRSRDAYEQFFDRVNAGLINWNTPTTGASGQLPFGGVGRSGNHRPAGFYMVDSCNVPVASLAADELQLPQTLVPGVTM